MHIILLPILVTLISERKLQLWLKFAGVWRNARHEFTFPYSKGLAILHYKTVASTLAVLDEWMGLVSQCAFAIDS